MHHHLTIDLNGTWAFAYTLSPYNDALKTRAAAEAHGLKFVSCTVPGNFELDLLAQGIIEDPFIGMNILQLRQFEKAHIWYSREFSVPDFVGEPELVFEGLDCIAEIYLNGELLATTDNMLIEHIIPVSGKLQPANELLIHIISPIEKAAEFDYPPGVSAGPNNMESLYVRKAPHMYGWDIMPRALSAGIWRPVTIRFKPHTRIDDVFLMTQSIYDDHTLARLYCRYQVAMQDKNAEYTFTITGRCGDSLFTQQMPVLFNAGFINFEVTNPQLWWPRDRGQANLYAVECTLEENGKVVDRYTFTHGIRTVKLDKTSLTDIDGNGQFLFYINGEPTFIKGTNWVPADAFHSRDIERIPKMIDMVEEIGCNMIRCWGGNVYENNLFYELCDQKGIMIWQDFTMACAAYPQDANFCERFTIEARAVVRRLRQHASLVLWAGDNECDQVLAMGWGNIPGDPNRNQLTRRVLPEVLHEEDPLRPFLPSSPYISPEAYCGNYSVNLPEDHLWGPRDYFKSDFYRNATCHFVSEIGYFGCPEAASLRKFLSPDKVWPYQDNAEWILHSTAPVAELHNNDYRISQMVTHLTVLFGTVPDTLDEFVAASQAAQGEAYKYFIEHFRGEKWRRTGIIWWNLIDGWPQFADSVVDYYFAKKRAFTYITRSQQTFFLMLREPVDTTQKLVAVNDTREPVYCSYTIHNVDNNAIVADGNANIPANNLVVLADIPFSANEQRCYKINWITQNGEGQNHYLAGIPPFNLEQYLKWVKICEL
jgi:beta-mannosidase